MSIQEKVERLQHYLMLIRISTGWSLTGLGNKLGVSRQMIYDLETGRIKMTIMQYRAIRDALNEECEVSPNDMGMVKDLLFAFVDEPERFTNKQLISILQKANLLAPTTISKKTTRADVAATWAALLTGVGAVAVTTAPIAPVPPSITPAVAAADGVLKKLFADKKEEKKK